MAGPLAISSNTEGKEGTTYDEYNFGDTVSVGWVGESLLLLLSEEVEKVKTWNLH